MRCRQRMNIVLASGSPRRKEILRNLYNDFEIISPDIDETWPEGFDYEEVPEYLAVKKARSVALDREDDLVIACDTCVFLDEKRLGKPRDKDEAREMLTALSGRVHTVITGCCVAYKGRQVSFSSKTLVKFYRLTDEEIEKYVNTDEPYDKAGAYGAQGKGMLLIHSIEGDYFNVVGLPLSRLKRVIDVFLREIV